METDSWDREPERVVAIIADLPGKVTCGRCRCRYEIAKKRADVETARCPELGCGRRFWHTEVKAVIRMGIDPSWLKDWGR